MRILVLLSVLGACVLVWAALNIWEWRHRRWLETANGADLAQYVSQSPHDAAALRRMCALLRGNGDASEAEKLIRRAVTDDPDNDDNWAEFARSISNKKEAIDALQRFLQLSPESGVVQSELALCYLQAGDIAKAQVLAEKATHESPENSDAWRALGEVLAAKKQTARAEEAFHKSLLLRDDTDTRLSLSRMLIPLQRYDEIVALCEPLVIAGANSGISKGQRAKALAYYGGSRLNLPASAEEYERIRTYLLEADSHSSSLLPEERFLPAYFLGECCIRMGQGREAVGYLERASAAAPQFPGSLYSLSRAYQMAGDTLKAKSVMARHTALTRLLGDMDSYRTRLEQHPDDSRSLLQFGDTLAALGSRDDAERAYQRVVALGQGEAEAARKKVDALKASR